MAVVEFGSLPELPGNVDPADFVLVRDTSTNRYFKVKVENLIVTSDVALANHESDFTNPHAVTKQQVGLGNVINSAQLTVTANLSDLGNSAIALNNLGGVSISQFNSHATSTANPHAVTASQLGVYTTAQTDDLLDDKAPLGHAINTANPHAVTAEQVGRDTAQWNANRIAGILIDDTAKADTRVLAFNSTNNTFEFVDANPGGGGISSISQATDTNFNLLVDEDLLFYNETLGAFTNSSITDIGLVRSSEFLAHVLDPNPHGITAAKVGLQNVLNTAQLAVENNLSDLLDIGIARDNMGLQSMAVQDESAVSILGGTITGVDLNSLVNPLAIADGGTGSTTPEAAVTALGAIPTSAIGSVNGVAGLDLDAKIPVVNIPDVDKSETVVSTAGQLSLPPTGKNDLKLFLTENTVITNAEVELNSATLPGEYHLYIEQNEIGGWTLNFSPDFILLNFPDPFVMPTAPGSYIHVTFRKVRNDTNLYTWLEPSSPPAPSLSKFSTLVGDGIATSVVVNHNLLTQDFVVNVYENTAPYSVVDEAVVTVQNTSASQATLVFASAPTVDQYKVVIIG